MKVVIAIDSLKGCLSSAEAGHAAADGVRARWPEAEIVCLPVSDGGEGWLEAIGGADSPPALPIREGAKCSEQASALLSSQVTSLITITVNDPLLRPVQARYLLAGETAVIEVAQACGLHLLRPEERNPLLASSRGVGELLLDAAQRGARRFIIGLGGSAVSDAGRGMVERVKEEKREKRKREKGSEECSFILATDVTNPLYGPNGAAAIFGPQKGATMEMVEELDRRARAFAEENARRMGFDRSGDAGAGAAGGLGYAFMQFFDAERRSGAELLLELLHFDELIRDVDLVITGEGKADRQTLMGKLPAVILRHAQRAGVPCHLLAGDVQDTSSLLAAGFASVRSINPPDLPLHEALCADVARQNMEHTSYDMIIA